MEGVLVQAVRLGAEEVSTVMERFEPAGVTVLSGVPRARGFVLDGYGVFFDVEIPDMNQSVIWSMMNVQRDRQVGERARFAAQRDRVDARGAEPSAGARTRCSRSTKTVGPAMPPTRSAGPAGSGARPGQRGRCRDARSQRPLFRVREGRARRSDARLQPADEPRSRGVVDRRGARQRRSHARGRACPTSSPS